MFSNFQKLSDTNVIGDAGLMFRHQKQTKRSQPYYRIKNSTTDKEVTIPFTHPTFEELCTFISQGKTLATLGMAENDPSKFNVVSDTGYILTLTRINTLNP